MSHPAATFPADAVGMTGGWDQRGLIMPAMRAKMRLNSVTNFGTTEVLEFNAVARSSSYPADGSDEDNTYAKFSPSGSLNLTVANPALLGKFTPGQTYYLDFTEVPTLAPASA